MSLKVRFCGFENRFVTKGEVTVWCSSISFGETLIDGYLNLGESFLNTAFEDHSFVIHDRKNNYVAAFRDFFGLFPLFYAFTSDRSLTDTSAEQGTLFLSFSVKAILDNWNQKAKINPERIVRYFDRENRGGLVNDQTFFKDIRRILPAHALIVQDGVREWKMTGFLDLKKNHTLTYRQLSDKFKDTFEQSVFRKSSGFNSIGANLSGGLDSSAISSVIQSKSEIQTFYVDIDSEDAEEKQFVNAVLSKWRLEGSDPRHYSVKPGKEFSRIISELTADIAQPEMMAIPISIFEPLVESAHLNGSDIILSGNGGDQVIGYGFDYMEELFESENWKKLSVAMRQYLRHYESQYSFLSPKWQQSTKRSKVRMFALYFFVSKWKKKKSLKNIFSSVFVLNKYFGIRAHEIFRLLKTKTTRKDKVPETMMFVKEDFSKNLVAGAGKTFDIEELVRHYALSDHKKQQLKYCFSDPGIIHNEEMFALFSKQNLQVDYPFFDKELLEVTINVTLSDSFREGKGRGILRDAMQDYLPQKVSERTSKGEFSEYGYRAFKSLWQDFKMRPDLWSHPVWDIISREAFDFSLEVIYNEKIKASKKNKHIWQASRVLYLAIWLDFVEEYNYQYKIRDSSVL
jgi:asparagine synthase (glutamine-hydrolysing)